jgi:hypothetical protein
MLPAPSGFTSRKPDAIHTTTLARKHTDFSLDLAQEPTVMLDPAPALNNGVAKTWHADAKEEGFRTDGR